MILLEKEEIEYSNNEDQISGENKQRAENSAEEEPGARDGKGDGGAGYEGGKAAPARELCNPEQLKDFLGANPSCSLSPSRKNGARLLCLQRALVLFPIKRVDTKSDFHSALSRIFSL